MELGVWVYHDLNESQKKKWLELCLKATHIYEAQLQPD